MALGNLFVLWSRLFGLAPAARLARLLAACLPRRDSSLEADSERIERCYSRFRYLFVARRQKCLIRGFLLYYYGKRARKDVRLIFGAAPSDSGAPKWHCWIVEARRLKFEIAEVIDAYTPFLEFA